MMIRARPGVGHARRFHLLSTYRNREDGNTLLVSVQHLHRHALRAAARNYSSPLSTCSLIKEHAEEGLISLLGVGD